MTGKTVRDVDRYQAVLASLLVEEENKYCADCQAKGTGGLPGGGGAWWHPLGAGAWRRADLLTLRLLPWALKSPPVSPLSRDRGGTAGSSGSSRLLPLRLGLGGDGSALQPAP